MSAAAAEGFPPTWVLLERYLFRRDDKDSFPDESKAPIRASATTSWGADFSIAFSVVEPPRVSRLYAHLPEPGFPHPDKELPLYMLATHRHLALSTDNNDLWKLSRWQTGTIIPFQGWLCWIDYQQGILFCDVSSKVPTISFLWFPVDKSPRTSTHKSPLTTTYKATCNIFYGGVSVVDHGRLLKFVHVARNDGLIYEALKPGADLTITCHTLVLGDGSMERKEDYTITFDDLLDHLPRGTPMFPHGIPMFPRVD
ncbi:unnamed protein product [Urochloa humidicola]